MTTIKMNINDILVPNAYTETPPKPEKLEEHINYYLEHGTLKGHLVVSQKGYLTDGYCSYLVAKSAGMKMVTCVLNTKRLKNIIPKNETINNRQRKRWLLYIAQNGRCSCCGKPLQITDPGHREDYLTIDHILPVCRGGSNGLENLQGMCSRCNYIKGGELVYPRQAMA